MCLRFSIPRSSIPERLGGGRSLADASEGSGQWSGRAAHESLRACDAALRQASKSPVPTPEEEEAPDNAAASSATRTTPGGSGTTAPGGTQGSSSLEEGREAEASLNRVREVDNARAGADSPAAGAEAGLERLRHGGEE